MSKVDPPFDESDEQSAWALLWVLSALAGGILWIVLDVFASARSVFNTASYVGAYYFPRMPWLVGGLVALFGGHMGMPQDFTLLAGYSLWAILAIFALYAGVWHVGQWMGWWHVLTGWRMLVNLNACLLAFYFVWPMRPTW